MIFPPCIRHGTSGIEDPRILKALTDFRERKGTGIEADLVSLVDYDGQLWVTWRTAELGQQHGAPLAEAWAHAGGERGALHLVRIEEDFDYQEDHMNEAAQTDA